MSDWYTVDELDPATLERLVGAWTDAPVENLETCGMLLNVARDQVLAYAPATLEPYPAGEVPDNLVLAQLRQAENLWNAGRVNSAGDLGEGSYTFTPRPLDKTIRQIIRPVSGYSDVL